MVHLITVLLGRLSLRLRHNLTAVKQFQAFCFSLSYFAFWNLNSKYFWYYGAFEPILLDIDMHEIGYLS
jgi:hypothetical protein